MDVHMTSKKLIKPSTPTPIHLQDMKISFFDEIMGITTIPVIFYYPPNTFQEPNQLEKSLSQVLSIYYPLAGRYIKEKLIVKCNDEGVEYSNATVNGELSEILNGKIDAKELNKFVPDHVEESAMTPLLAIQVTIFKCGGLSIGLRFSHRIMDTFTLSLFVNGWAKACKEGIKHVSIPKFEFGNMFPARNIEQKRRYVVIERVTKRFVFDANAISRLKAEVCMSGIRYTIVELIVGLIWRAQVNMTRARNSWLMMTMNLRGRLVEKIPDNCCGNLLIICSGKFSWDASKTGLIDFIDLAKEMIRKNVVEYGKPMDGQDELFSKVIRTIGELREEIRKGVDCRMFSSWRNFGLYEVDFGWGRPAWISVAEVYPPEMVILMDRKDGDGIEAWVTLSKEEMTYFQRDHDIARFSCY